MIGRGEWIRTTDLLVPNLGKAVLPAVATGCVKSPQLSLLLLVHPLARLSVCTALLRLALLRCMRMANFWQRLVENLDLLGDVLRAQVRISECCLQGFVAKNFLDGHEAGAVHD